MQIGHIQKPSFNSRQIFTTRELALLQRKKNYKSYIYNYNK